MKSWAFAAPVCGLLSLTATLRADPIEIHGITFPGGLTSFADEVVSASWPVNGGPGAGFDDPAKALGIPDYLDAPSSYYSLGDGGYVIVRFTDNYLTGNGDPSADLYIFGGPNTDWESAGVEISANGTDWFFAGMITEVDGGLDIDVHLGSGPFFSFVRITDDPLQGGQDGPSVGFDLDAVGAISSVPIVPPSPIPEPATLLLAGAGLALAGLKRRRR